MTGISLLLNSALFIHRHLDWRLPLEWLDIPPFWVIEDGNRLRSLLAIPADPPDVAWVRLFAASVNPDPLLSWRSLFDHCLAELPRANQTTIAALGLSEWFTELLPRVGFSHHQNIIVLVWDGFLPKFRPLPSEIHIHRMSRQDLPRVQQIDALSFEPIWRNSIIEVERSFEQAGYATVAEMDGEVIGYQISTITSKHLHLARLAVHPDLQRLSIGYGIVYDLLLFSQQEKITSVTVNTQDSNLASQNLYRKCQFKKTGDLFPVFIYQ